MIEIRWKEHALKFLRCIEKRDSKRIVQKINFEVRENPERYLKSLVGLDFFKIRIGDFRVFADYDRASKVLSILTIKRRGNAYKSGIKDEK